MRRGINAVTSILIIIYDVVIGEQVSYILTLHPIIGRLVVLLKN